MNNSAKYLKNILTLVVLYSLTFSALAEIDIELLRKAEERRPPDHLYVKNPKDIEKMTTVTYYLNKSSRNSNDNLIELFYRYADDINESNGAVAINMKDKTITGGDDKKYYDFVIKNKICNIPKDDELPALIFEHKKEKKCFTFLRISGMEFEITINQFLQQFKEKTGLIKLGKYELDAKKEKFLDDVTNKFPELSIFKEQLRGLMETYIELRRKIFAAQ